MKHSWFKGPSILFTSGSDIYSKCSVRLLNEYLLNTYYVPNTFLGAGKFSCGQLLAFPVLTAQWGRWTISGDEGYKIKQKKVEEEGEGPAGLFARVAKRSLAGQGTIRAEACRSEGGCWRGGGPRGECTTHRHGLVGSSKQPGGHSGRGMGERWAVEPYGGAIRGTSSWATIFSSEKGVFH